jgi:flavin reductase (DIM6/NTAB) family NADH-FMN oxidoreductase RutF
MFYDAIANDHGLPHDPFKGLEVPRPIGWISSLDRDGRANLAPYSYFNAISDHPHLVMFSSGGRKDSLTNIERTGEFVCNLAAWDLRHRMNASSVAASPEVSEFDVAGLQMAPSIKVRPPRVAAAPAALECRYVETVKLTDADGVPSSYHMVIGQVIGIHITDAAIVGGIVDVTRLRPVARLGYREYAVVTEAFEMNRPRDVEIARTEAESTA